MYEKVMALLMNNSRLRSFIWILSYAIGNCSEIHGSKWSISSLFWKSNKTWQNRLFERLRCSSIYVLPMKKRRLKNIVSLKCGKTRFVSAYSMFFYNEKCLNSSPDTEGGGVAVKFSAEKKRRWTGPHGKLVNVFVSITFLLRAWHFPLG